MATLEDEQFKGSHSIELEICNMDRLNKGALVEVCSDEDGFQGAWFAATVINQFLIDVVDSNHIRPHPIHEAVNHFCVVEEVDALYNDGWWVGVISKVVGKQKYEVYFRGIDEEMVFKQSDLRRHQEWIYGKWVSSSLEVIQFGF
ncbi:hypothetical protein L2E82_19529 [Cichorium intybus]|uniref:Uncharacterized protein n=1 Tax=Cichorium intybus TaxID=13427 RepID=A0ACB9FBK8_CICIN|nr:hypothetical protein L2E82_19529 [Cichorium intybus]